MLATRDLTVLFVLLPDYRDAHYGITEIQDRVCFPKSAPFLRGSAFIKKGAKVGNGEKGARGTTGTAFPALLFISLSPVPYLSPLDHRTPLFTLLIGLRSSAKQASLEERAVVFLWPVACERRIRKRGGCHPVERYFCAVYDYAAKADLSKGCWIPNGKL